MSNTRKFATAVAVAAIGTGAFASGASAAISGGAYTATQTTNQTFTAGGLTAIARTASFVGNANGTNTTQFRPTFGDVSAAVAGNTYKAVVATNADWTITRTGALSGGTYSGTAAILAPASGNSVAITVYNQAYNGTPVTGSPAVLATVIVNSTSNGTLSQVNATPGPPSTISANVSGITFSSTGPLSGTIGSGATATYVGSVSAPGVTVSAP